MDTVDCKWAYSTNEENYYGSEDTPELALKEAIGDEDDREQFFIGQCKAFVPGIRPASIIEQLKEDASEECGEHGDDWLDSVTREQEKELGDLLQMALLAWIQKNKLEPWFYSIHNVREYVKNESGEFVCATDAPQRSGEGKE